MVTVPKRRRAGTENPIRGDLIHWARTQQSLSLEDVHQREGPSRSFQSEVENGIKPEVSSVMLRSWAKALNVTVPFLRGEVPRVSDQPHACAGLAGGVRALLTTPDAPDWVAMSSRARIAQLLSLIVKVDALPTVVLAYVLSLEVASLRAIMHGEDPVAKPVIEHLKLLTLLPDAFFEQGLVPVTSNQDHDDAFRSVFLLARRRGVPPDVLYQFVRQWTPPPPPPDASGRQR